MILLCYVAVGVLSNDDGGGFFVSFVWLLVFMFLVVTFISNTNENNVSW